MDLEPFIDSGTLLVENVFENRLRETISSSRLGKGLEIREKDRVSQIKILSKGVDVVVQDEEANGLSRVHDVGPLVFHGSCIKHS